MIAILLLLSFACTRATKPSFLALSCNKADAALMWLNGAQDAALVIVQALFGGVTCDGGLAEACYENAELLDEISCLIARETSCPDGCHLDRHIVLDDECCKYDDEQAFEGGAGSVCRSNRKWISIMFDKLYTAYDEYDKATDDSYALAIELACAAEEIGSSIIPVLNTVFATYPQFIYRHIVSGQKRVSYYDWSSTVSTLVRTVQSFRRDCNADVCTNHTLIATYSLFRTDVDVATMKVGTHQLLWPIGGTISAFDKTGLPANARCSLIGAPPSRDPPTTESSRMPTLGRLDYARVVQSFSRCSGFPVSGCVQGYHDLAIERCCNTLTLIKDITKAAHLIGKPVSRVYSFVYVAHINSAITYESDPARDLRVDNDLMVRTATVDQCADAEVTLTVPAGVVVSASPYTVLTLAPGESRCVGGSDSGKICTARNQCGAGLACKARPGAKKSFCFDGTWWNEAMPCTLNSQCPYGECYGAVSGDAGGEYPFLHIAKENSCDDPERATAICNDPKVKNWFNNPRNKVKRL